MDVFTKSHYIGAQVSWVWAFSMSNTYTYRHLFERYRQLAVHWVSSRSFLRPAHFPQNMFLSKKITIFSSGLCLCILHYRPRLSAGDQEVEEKGVRILFVYYPHPFPVFFGFFLSFKKPLWVFWEPSWCLLRGTRLTCSSPTRWRTSAETSRWCLSRTRLTWSHRARLTSESNLTFST